MRHARIVAVAKAGSLDEHEALEHLTFIGLQIHPPEVRGLEEKRPRKTCFALVPTIAVLLEHPQMEISVGPLGDRRLKHCDLRC